MTGPEEADLFRRGVALGVRGDSPLTPDCLDERTVAALAEGALDAEIRATALAHLAACARCRTTLASVARALADPAVAREVRAADGDRRRGRPSIGWIAVGVAAAAVLLLLAWPPQLDERLPPHRAPPITAAPAPEAVWPVGPVADASSFRWTAVSGADLYRVTLFDAEGEVLYETELAGTVAALPDSVPLAPGGIYWWRVDARLGFDRWAASELIEFSIARGPRR